MVAVKMYRKKYQLYYMATFPILHGEATTGKTKVWSIRVIENEGCGIIETIHGYLGGLMQTNQKTITTGKNIGKKNATTAFQQAVSESKSAWIKKKEMGYSELVTEKNSNDVSGVVVSTTEEPLENTLMGKCIDDTLPFPMLAHEYTKRGKTDIFKKGCYVQPKLDGTRCLGVVGKGLFSRNRKIYSHLEHIRAELNKLPVGIILDGELYSDKMTFQEVVGLVKLENLKKGDAERQRHIKYHIYDVMNDKPYQERYTNLENIFRNNYFQHLVLVSTITCDSEEKMKEQHAAYVEAGYEGIMLRARFGMYKNARSVDLLKYKEFFDDEYEIIGYEQGIGLEAGCIIWICKTPEGRSFSCRPRGTREGRQELFLRGKEYIGKMLTVRYQELTSSEHKVPRFPVGISVRDYE